jgi:hypothetical protein
MQTTPAERHAAKVAAHNLVNNSLITLTWEQFHARFTDCAQVIRRPIDQDVNNGGLYRWWYAVGVRSATMQHPETPVTFPITGLSEHGRVCERWWKAGREFGIAHAARKRPPPAPFTLP